MKSTEIKNIKTLLNTNENSFEINNSEGLHIPYILNGELYEIQSRDCENVRVTCCNCSPDRVYRGSIRSTGNFHMHIKRRHPNLIPRLQEMKKNALFQRRERFNKMKNAKNYSLFKNENQIQSGKVSPKLIPPEVSVCDQNFSEISKSGTNLPINGKFDTEPINYSLKEEYQCVGYKKSQNLPCDAEIMTMSTELSNSNIKKNIVLNTIKNEKITFDHPIDLSLEKSNTNSRLTSNLMRNFANNINIPTIQGNFTWENILLQLDQSLKGIQREMGARNLIETHRLLLDLAKFKYSHPGFSF